mmetsp:Transcript_15206/g.31865  ORF Transcript_15206/g.31865 Transcript_15206/m.31865 type:complete len:200 (-) Transcript_15206:1482-2081(-)
MVACSPIQVFLEYRQRFLEAAVLSLEQLAVLPQLPQGERELTVLGEQLSAVCGMEVKGISLHDECMLCLRAALCGLLMLPRLRQRHLCIRLRHLRALAPELSLGTGCLESTGQLRHLCLEHMRLRPARHRRTRDLRLQVQLPLAALFPLAVQSGEFPAERGDVALRPLAHRSHSGFELLDLVLLLRSEGPLLCKSVLQL